MKTIIAGSRSITDYSVVLRAIKESGFYISEVVCGLANGPDILGEKYALEHNIPVTYFPADWRDLGKAAGYIRNEQMGEYSECLIACWDGESKGTKHMIEYAKKKGLLTYVKNTKDTSESLGIYYE